MWPTPVDADACFVAAGFHEFDDSNEKWDQDWRNLVIRTLQQLGQVGTLHVRMEADVYKYDSTASIPRRALGWFLADKMPLKKFPLSLVDQIITVTSDDRFGDVLVDFGEPARSCLLSGRGHAILWIGWASTDWTPGGFIERIAGGLPVIRTTLKWHELLPNTGQAGHL
jgi:hypothetical protein